MGEITHRTDYCQLLLDEKSCDTIRGFHVTSFASSFLFTPYSHYAEWWYLDNERTTVWENGKPITSNTKYEYNNDYRKQVSKTTTYADREVVREESKHTCDVPTYSHMADMNRIFPVENNRYRNGKFVFGTRNDYDENLVVGNISQKTAEQPNYESRIGSNGITVCIILFTMLRMELRMLLPLELFRRISDRRDKKCYDG